MGMSPSTIVLIGTILTVTGGLLAAYGTHLNNINNINNINQQEDLRKKSDKIAELTKDNKDLIIKETMGGLPQI